MTGSPIPTIRSRIPEPGSRIPTDGQIWPEQIGIRGRIKSESAIGLNRNQWSVWVGIRTYSLEMFRKQVSLQVERGRRSSVNFRTAERFGLISVVNKPVVFWFEQYEGENK